MKSLSISLILYCTESIQAKMNGTTSSSMSFYEKCCKDLRFAGVIDITAVCINK